ncbi:MAG: TIGR02391 family protein [Thaumarchaeota archaeon]|nr:TIGR02391 family protein [Nitrososphaerota archaeon]
MPAGGIAEIGAIVSLRGGKDAHARLLPRPTLGHLARIVGGAYGWQDLLAILEEARVGGTRRGRTSRRDFLYGVLVRLQEDGDHAAITRILVAACGPRAGKGGAREEVNGCLRLHGLKFDADGSPVQVGGVRRPPGTDAQAFDQRGYHALVARHARARFSRGDYFGAVGECYKWLEKEVRQRSGLGLSGKALMTEALGGAGPLEMSLPHMLAQTQRDATEGLMHLCAGVSLNVRNPMSHETDEDVSMTREEALDKLTVMSYILGQLDRAGRRRGPRRAVPKSGRGAARDAAARGGGRPHAGVLGAGEAGPKSGERPAVWLEVSPGRVEEGGRVRVTVTGSGIGGWHAGVYSESGDVMSSPTRLDAHGPAAISASGEATYKFSVTTVNYGPGEYRVSVSSDRGMDAEGTRIKKFVVANRREAEADEVMDAVEELECRVGDLERGEWPGSSGFHPVDALGRAPGQARVDQDGVSDWG